MKKGLLILSIVLLCSLRAIEGADFIKLDEIDLGLLGKATEEYFNNFEVVNEEDKNKHKLLIDALLSNVSGFIGMRNLYVHKYDIFKECTLYTTNYCSIKISNNVFYDFYRAYVIDGPTLFFDARAKRFSFIYLLYKLGTKRDRSKFIDKTVKNIYTGLKQKILYSDLNYKWLQSDKKSKKYLMSKMEQKLVEQIIEIVCDIEKFINEIKTCKFFVCSRDKNNQKIVMPKKNSSYLLFGIYPYCLPHIEAFLKNKLMQSVGCFFNENEKKQIVFV